MCVGWKSVKFAQPYREQGKKKLPGQNIGSKRQLERVYMLGFFFVRFNIHSHIGALMLIRVGAVDFAILYGKCMRAHKPFSFRKMWNGRRVWKYKCVCVCMMECVYSVELCLLKEPERENISGVRVWSLEQREGVRSYW